jgi:AcrR family transcriptional regulator
MTSSDIRPTSGRGRPRKNTARASAGRPIDEFLHVSAQLFVERGFAATTTRAITDAVGVQQGALYYHFSSKDAILAELLRRVIARPLAYSRKLLSMEGMPASTRLASLARFDAHELLIADFNIGSLFFLPEIRRPEFAQFRTQRSELRSAYLRLILDAIQEDALPPLPIPEGRGVNQVPLYLVDAAFGLVESVIAIREDRTVTDAETIASTVQASVLRLLGYDQEKVRGILQDADGLPSAQIEEGV